MLHLVVLQSRRYIAEMPGNWIGFSKRVFCTPDEYYNVRTAIVYIQRRNIIDCLSNTRRLALDLRNAKLKEQ